jgi:asparagine N-glycosylation enzyme membrane subunit Stt3
MVGFLYSLIVTLLPLGTVVFFIVSLVRYVSGKKAGCEGQELKRRKILLVVSSVMMGVLVASLVGIIVLLYMAIAFM